MGPYQIATQFIKTPKFLAIKNSGHDFDVDDDDDEDAELPSTAPSVPPGLTDTDEVGGAYVTVSQQASERSQQPPPPAVQEFESK